MDVGFRRYISTSVYVGFQRVFTSDLKYNNIKNKNHINIYMVLTLNIVSTNITFYFMRFCLYFNCFHFVHSSYEATKNSIFNH